MLYEAKEKENYLKEILNAKLRVFHAEQLEYFNLHEDHTQEQSNLKIKQELYRITDRLEGMEK